MSHSTVIFLPGWGHTSEGRVGATLREILSAEGAEMIYETYHPGGDEKATRPISFIESLAKIAVEKQAQGREVHIVGYSTGGYLAAAFAATHPTALTSALLLAPAIDLVERKCNGDETKMAKWESTKAFGGEFATSKFPPRPVVDTVQVPTIIVHGKQDTDEGGSAPERIQEWVDHTLKLPGSNVELHTPDINHQLSGKSEGRELPWMEEIVEQPNVTELHRLVRKMLSFQKPTTDLAKPTLLPPRRGCDEAGLWEWCRRERLTIPAAALLPAGDWGVYDPKQNLTIEDSMLAGEEDVHVEIGLRNYSIQLDKDHPGYAWQHDVMLSKCRLVRRRLVSSEELERSLHPDTPTTHLDQDTCALCFTEFAESATMPVVQLPSCKHVFHQACACQLADAGRPCPCCRIKVDWSIALPRKMQGRTKKDGSEAVKKGGYSAGREVVEEEEEDMDFEFG